MKKQLGMWVGVAGLLIVTGFAAAVNLSDSRDVRNLAAKPSLVQRLDVGLLFQSVPAYQIDAANSTTTYVRVSGVTSDEYVKRILTVGTLTSIEFSFCNWTNRTTATYTAINGL